MKPVTEPWLIGLAIVFFLCVTSLAVSYFIGDAALYDAIGEATSRTVNRGIPGLDEAAARAQILANDNAEEAEYGKNPPTIVVGEKCPPYVPGAKIVLLRMGPDGKAVEAHTCIREYKHLFSKR
jgi:hypothetical protein